MTSAETTAPDRSPFNLGTSVVLLVIGVGIGYTVTTMIGLGAMAMSLMSAPVLLTDVVMKTGLLIGTVSFIVPAYVYMRHSKKKPVPVFRLQRVGLSTLFFTVLLIAGLFVVTDAIDRAIAPSINGFLDRTIGTLSPELQSERILQRQTEEFTIRHWFSGMLLILAAVGAAGVCEEMLLRGMFQQALETRCSAVWAIVVSSLVFSLIHLNPWGGLQIFVAAVVLGWVAWRTGSIVPTILMHGLNNLAAIVIQNTDPQSLLWYGDKQAISTQALIGGIVLLGIGGTGVYRSKSKAIREKGQI